MATVHAEVSAMSKIPKNMLNGADIVVIRNNGSLKNSKPCLNCLNKMKKYGIRQVYYSDYGGNIVSEYVNEMNTSYVSCGIRHNYKKI